MSLPLDCFQRESEEEALDEEVSDDDISNEEASDEEESPPRYARKFQKKDPQKNSKNFLPANAPRKHASATGLTTRVLLRLARC